MGKAESQQLRCTQISLCIHVVLATYLYAMPRQHFKHHVCAKKGKDIWTCFRIDTFDLGLV